MPMDCEQARDHVDARALGALDADDARALEAHLATCAECRALAAKADETAASLGLAVPVRAAGQALKARVMAAATVLTDIRPHRLPYWWRGAAAAALVLLAGAVTWASLAQIRVRDLEDERATIAASATAQSGELQAVQARLDAAAAEVRAFEQRSVTTNAIITVALQDDAQQSELTGTEMAPGAKARCVWSRATALGALIAEDLPAPPTGSLYEIWIVYENGWVSGGRFGVDGDGGAQLVMERPWSAGDLGPFVGFAVTLEPDDTAREPSERLVLQSAVVR